MQIEGKLQAMGITLPDLRKTAPDGKATLAYYGELHGKMKPFHRSGNLLVLSGHVPDLPMAAPCTRCSVGAEVSVEQAYQAARGQTGINSFAGIKQAIGDLDQVTSLVRTLISSSVHPASPSRTGSRAELTDLFAALFGPERGIGCRATIGVISPLCQQPLLREPG